MLRWFVMFVALMIFGCLLDSKKDPPSLAIGYYQGPTRYYEHYKNIPVLKIVSRTKMELSTTEFEQGYSNNQYGADYPNRTLYCNNIGNWTIKGDSLIFVYIQAGCADNGGGIVTDDDISKLTLDNALPGKSRYALSIRMFSSSGFELGLRDSTGVPKWDPWVRL